MAFDLKKVLDRKRDAEWAARDDFAFRWRVRTIRLLIDHVAAEDPAMPLDRAPYIAMVPTADDEAILTALSHALAEAGRPVPDAVLAAWFATAHAEAEAQLRVQIGRPDPAILV